MKPIDSASQIAAHPIDLRTGLPYANLIRGHERLAETVGAYFGVNPDDVIPTAGATGAIEAIRNHIFRLSLKPTPILLTVSPGYWRARESFQGFGFRVTDIKTEAARFEIDEAALVQAAAEIHPDIVYLSLPNNPTGAVFDPRPIVNGMPETTAVIFDLTLPSRKLNTQELVRALCSEFRLRRKLFFAGSTSKSHNTAEYRIGWAICANSEDAITLKAENRNVVSLLSVEEASRRLQTGPSIIACIEESHRLLKQVAAAGKFELIEPRRQAETSYVLIKFAGAPEGLRAALDQRGIAVMWGSEFGLTDAYVRLETSETEHVRTFVDALLGCPIRQQSTRQIDMRPGV